MVVAVEKKKKREGKEYQRQPGNITGNVIIYCVRSKEASPHSSPGTQEDTGLKVKRENTFFFKEKASNSAPDSKELFPTLLGGSGVCPSVGL